MTADNGTEAVANARQHTTYEPGYCQRYTREAWEVGSLYGSAQEAWNGSTQKHPGDRSPPLGAPCYWSGGSHGYGHAVVFVGNGDIRSTDCQSTGKVSEVDLEWVERSWPGFKFLGWTGDINAADLPLADNIDEGEDMPDYDHAASDKGVNLKPEEWAPITWTGVPSGDAFREGEQGCRIAGRRYTAVLHATFEAPQGATVRMKTTEQNPETNEQEESNPQTEAAATSGSTFATHPQIGAVRSDCRLRFMVACSQSARLVKADVTVLSWP